MPHIQVQRRREKSRGKSEGRQPFNPPCLQEQFQGRSPSHCEFCCLTHAQGSTAFACCTALLPAPSLSRGFSPPGGAVNQGLHCPAPERKWHISLCVFLPIFPHPNHIQHPSEKVFLSNTACITLSGARAYLPTWHSQEPRPVPMNRVPLTLLGALEQGTLTS